MEDSAPLALQTLNWLDIVAAAAQMNIEPCTLQAVCTVEASGNGFLPSGRPKILFEGHIFWRELAKRHYQPERLASDFPSILYQRWTNQFYQGGEKEYERLAMAQSIHHEAAYCSTSWGAFQIMGFNYALCGFHSVTDFVAAQQQSCSKQLEAFCKFLITNNLQVYLQNKDWTAFARRYNGPEYVRNQYDKKLEIAYRSCQHAHS
ncbi:N-acetylmuramidase family protein [Kluyvera genomosp. 1]|uniref:N-acetylmuramidase family protein n=1 Tax=Kluyvera genomosp. 1 TaxID=2774053 RepID=UPI0018D0D37F|nr:N-acetylmuramidase family protein [Kluyvera genomosp. 1]